MKPRTTLAETSLPDGSTLALQDHDGRLSLLIHGQQICGSGTKAAEEEAARLACAPFRPARQPKLWFAGIGLGHMLSSAATELLQKRGTFIVAEPSADLVAWHRTLIPNSPLTHDPRVTLTDDCGPKALSSESGSLHAILLHLDASPLNPGNQRPWTDDPRWLSAAFEALQPGGLLAIAGTKPIASLSRRLQRSGFEVAQYSVPCSPQAKKSRLHPIWLARKFRQFA
jgi:spermidine synthase